MSHIPPRRYKYGRYACGRRVRSALLPLADEEDPDSPPKYGLILFEGGARRARQIILAFDSAAEADSFAVNHHYADYLVAPLSFLAPLGIRRQSS